MPESVCVIVVPARRPQPPPAAGRRGIVEMDPNILEISLPDTVHSMSEVELFLDLQQNELEVMVNCRIAQIFRVPIPEQHQTKSIHSAKFSRKKHRLLVRFVSKEIIGDHRSRSEKSNHFGQDATIVQNPVHLGKGSIVCEFLCSDSVILRDLPLYIIRTEPYRSSYWNR